MALQKWLFSFSLIFSVIIGSNSVWSMDLTDSALSKTEGAETSKKSFQIAEIHKVVSLVSRAQSLAEENMASGEKAAQEALKFKGICKPVDRITQKTDTRSSDQISSIHFDKADRPFGVEVKGIKFLGEFFTLGKIDNPITHKRDGILLGFTIANF